MMHRARLVAEIGLHRYGAWPLLGVAGLAISALCAWLVVQPVRNDTSRLRSELKAAVSTPAVPASPASAPTSDLLGLLPPAASSNATLDTLFELARKQQLRLVQAEYQRGRETHAKFETLQVSMALSGTYPAVRHWVEDVLRTFPHASVDQIGFERNAVANAQVTVRVKVTLWLAPAGEMR